MVLGLPKMVAPAQGATFMMGKLGSGGHALSITWRVFGEHLLRGGLIWIGVQILIKPQGSWTPVQWVCLGTLVYLGERALSWSAGLLSSRWVASLFRSFVLAYSNPKRLGMFAWVDEDARDLDVPFLASESLPAVEDFVEWYLSFVQSWSALVVLFLAFTLFAPISFFPFLLFSLVAGFVLARWLWRQNLCTQGVLNEGRGRLSMLLLGSWDNVSLGNDHNRKQWIKRFLRETEGLETSRNKRFKEGFVENSAVLLFVALPLYSFLFNQYSLSLQNGGADGVVFLFLLVTLSLRWFPSAFRGVFCFPSILEVLRKVEKTVNRKTEEVPEERLIVDWNQLVFSKEGARARLSSLEEVERYTKSFSAGRHALTGPEHSGKTALLLHIKQMFPERAYYFPGQSTLNFEFEEHSDQSGLGGSDVSNLDLGMEERLLKCLQEIKEVSRGGIVLLDDWDVYLDPRAAERVNQAIEDLSLFRCVFETRRTAF